MSNTLAKIEIQKQIIEKVVKHLTSLGNDIYYQSTINICSEIHDIIKAKKFLSKEDTAMVAKLNHKEIQSLLSCSTSCC